MKVKRAQGSRSYRGAKGVRSRSHNWRRERCPCCNMRYADLKTGWTWTDAQVSARQAVKSGDRTHYSRGTVLGIWFQYKQGLWSEHLASCQQYAESQM